MATLDIFNDDAFRVSALIDTITDIPRVPSQIRDEGLFTEYGIMTPTVMIERQGRELSLVPTAPRGAPGQPVSRTGRKLIPMAAVHLPQTGAVLADEVYGVREFGSETEVMQVQALVRDKLAVMRESMDLTLEHMMVGALKGLVVDADGTTPIWNMYDIFGFTQKVIPMNIDTANTTVDLKQKCIDIKRAVRNSLGGRAFSGVRVKCSESWFDKFVGHNQMKAAWDRWNNGAFLRQDQTETDFEFAGVSFRIYSGGTGTSESMTDFIPANTAFAYPTGVPRMFHCAYAPADYMETVNTMGTPYYAKQERMKFDRGVELEAQSNPLVFNKLPEAVVKLITAASV
jgi:hypothetical protein